MSLVPLRLMASFVCSVTMLFALDAVTVDANGNMVLGTDPQAGDSEILRTQGVLRAANVLSGQTPVAISAATTLTATAFGNWHLVSGTSADYTITLPAAAGNQGKCLGVRVLDATQASKSYTVAAAGSEKIDGAASVALTANAALVLMSDGTQWARIGGTATGAANWWARVTSEAAINISGSATAVVNRMHEISGTDTDYFIVMPAAVTGDVCGFYVKDWEVAKKQYILQATGKKIAGRTGYLALIHTNSALLRYDGVNWVAISMELSSPYVDFVSPGIVGQTSNPTKGTTEKDVIRWCRSGNEMHFFYQYRQTGAGANGSGSYRINLPFAMDADVDIVPSCSDLGESLASSDSWAESVIGHGSITNGSTFSLVSALHATTGQMVLQRVNESARSYWGSTNYSLGGSTIRVGVRGSIPIKKW